jgi:hypothetical protein
MTPKPSHVQDISQSLSLQQWLGTHAMPPSGDVSPSQKPNGHDSTVHKVLREACIPASCYQHSGRSLFGAQTKNCWLDSGIKYMHTKILIPEAKYLPVREPRNGEHAMVIYFQCGSASPAISL